LRKPCNNKKAVAACEDQPPRSGLVQRLYIGNTRKTDMARIPDTEIQRLKEEVTVQRLI
jgi:hypothetical protein